MTKAKILVFRDRSIPVQDIAAKLQRLGFGVLAVVSTEEEAIRMSAETNPDLVLVDLVAPGEPEALAVGEWIHTLFGIPVVYLADPSAEDALQQTGLIQSDGYLIRPFKDHELRIVCDRAISLHRLQRKLEDSQRAEEQLRRRVEELYALQATILDISTPHDLPTLLPTIVECAARLVHASRGALYLCEPGQAQLRCIVSHNTPRDYRGTLLRYGEGAAGIVAQTGAPLIIDDYPSWPARAAVFEDDRPFKSVLAVPMTRQGQVTGVIEVAHDRDRPFTQANLELLTLFASHATTAVENTRLYKSAPKDRARFEAGQFAGAVPLFAPERTAYEPARTFQAATQALTATLDLQQVFERILAELRRVVPYDSATIQQLQGEELVIIGGHGFPNLEELLGIRFGLTRGDNPNQEVVRTRAPVILEDAPLVYEEFGREPHARAEIRSWLGVPLLFGDRLIGMLALDKKDPGFYTTNHAHLAMAFAAQAAIAIESARLFQAEREQRELARRLQETALLVNSSLDRQEVLELILDQLARVVPYDSGTIQILEPDATRVIAVRNLPATELGHRYPLDRYPYNRRLVQEKKPIVVQDVYDTDQCWIPLEELDDIRSNIGVPLQVRDRIIGVLTIDSHQSGAYTEADAQIAQAFAQQAAIAIENARLFQAEREQRELAEALRLATTAISSTLDLEQVLDQILDQMNRVIPSDAANVMLIEDDHARIVRWRGYDRFGNDEFLKSAAFRLDETPTLHQMYETREALVISDTANHDGWVQNTDQPWLRSLAAAPICARDKVIGFLRLDSATPRFFDQAHAERLRVFADQASLALEHARLYEAEQHQAAEAAAISTVVQALNATTDLDSVFRVIVRELHRLVDFDHLSIALPADDQHLVVYTLTGVDGVTPGDGLIVPVADTAAAATVLAGRPHLTPDLATEIDLPGDRALYDAGLRSRLNLPLLLGQTVIGALNLASFRPKAFSLDDLPLLIQVADAVAARVQTVRLYEEILHRNRELALLNRIIAASAASQEIEAILETVCRELALAFDLPYSAAAMFNEEKTAAVVVAEYLAEGLSSLLGQIASTESSPSARYMLEHRAPLVVDDAQTDPRLEPLHDQLHQLGTISLLVLPLMVEAEVVGSLGLDAVEHRPFSHQEVDLAWRVAEQVSGSLARTRLVETQRRLSTAVEQAAEAVVITDTEGCALYVNPAFERITGHRQADVIGSPPHTWIGDRAADTPYTDLWSAASTNNPWKSRSTSTRPDGSFYTVDLTVTPVQNESGDIVNYVATLRDVTREVRLEEQFHQAQKMEALGQLAGGIAHDFNNLLTVIHLSTQLLRRRLRPDDPLWEHVLRIEETGTRAAKLTKQLLSFSRREIVEPKIVNVNDLVGELGNMLQRIIGENIQLRTNLADNLWQVKVDSSQIDQVILNLVVNARDAMPHGGTLTIETSNVILDQAYAALHVDAEPGKYVLLSISDTGVGMDEQVRAHLFEPFFTTKEPGQGTGLGLATVFGIIKQNHGHIRVRSQVGRGTAFDLYLPCAGEAEVSQPPPPLPAVAGRLAHGTETVLVVEDKPDVRALAVDVLKSCGYHVLAAEDGLDALQVSQEYQGPIHLLLTDVVMPHLNGTELAKRLKAQRPQVRVLFMSGYADSSILKRSYPGADAFFLPKPFTVEDLTQKVRTALDSRV